jgi:hypothetical protein
MSHAQSPCGLLTLTVEVDVRMDIKTRIYRFLHGGPLIDPVFHCMHYELGEMSGRPEDDRHRGAEIETPRKGDAIIM